MSMRKYNIIICLIHECYHLSHPWTLSHVSSMSVFTCLAHEWYHLSIPWVLSPVSFMSVIMSPLWVLSSSVSPWMLSPVSSMSVIICLLHECYHLSPPWVLSYVSSMSIITCLLHECYGIHLDWTLWYKRHIEKTKMKVNTRNSIFRKLANSNWGCKASTLRPSCLALCYSAAEYACPVWAMSTHARKLNPTLHECCRIISGCLKPTNLDIVYILAGIAPSQIRRTVACRMECTPQTTDVRHQLRVKIVFLCSAVDLTRFNKIAIQGTPQMAVD